MSIHQPVLLRQAIQYLNPLPGQNFIDCTLGGGGHTQEILNRIGSKGKLLAIDASPGTLKEFRDKYVDLIQSKKIILVQDNFKNLKQIVKDNSFFPVHGILADLGLSSDLLEDSQRGFSFQKNEFLDMRFDPEQELTAAKIINGYSEEELIEIFKELGEERFSRRIAQRIVQARKKEPIKTTQELSLIIQQSLGRFFRNKSLARIFQALRIEVNQELKALKELLEQSKEILAPKARIVIISYHSLEDRIVKHFFKKYSCLKEKPYKKEIFSEKKDKDCFKILTRKPVIPEQDEIERNPRSRSAKLRVAEKI